MSIVAVVLLVMNTIVSLIFGFMAAVNIFSTLRIPPLLAQNELNLTIAKLLQAIALLLFVLACSGLSIALLPFLH